MNDSIRENYNKFQLNDNKYNTESLNAFNQEFFYLYDESDYENSYEIESNDDSPNISQKVYYPKLEKFSEIRNSKKNYKLNENYSSKENEFNKSNLFLNNNFNTTNYVIDSYDNIQEIKKNKNDETKDEEKNTYELWKSNCVFTEKNNSDSSNTTFGNIGTILDNVDSVNYRNEVKNNISEDIDIKRITSFRDTFTFRNKENQDIIIENNSNDKNCCEKNYCLIF